MSALPSIDIKADEIPPKTYSLGFLAAVAIGLQTVASLCYPIAKYGLETIEPFTFAFYRYVISSTVLLAIVKFKKYKTPVARKDYFRVILIGFLIIPFNQTLFLVGQSMTAAGHGAFLFATTPVFIFILALIHLKEKLVWRRAIGITLALAGVMTIMSSGAIEVSTHYLLGDMIIIVSVTAWAYYTILGKDLVRKYGALRMTAYALSAGSALYFPFGLYMALKYDYSQATLGAWGSVLYMALGLSVFVYVLWYWLLKYMDASRVAVYHNIQPVIATVVAYVFLGEVLTVPFIIGGLIVLAGVITSEV
ncbi:MAG: EamA family transporter [candidate division Zixibacteria bacterium]|nr:EamA family transporter [candidate division Zixibacteria bacterium]